MAARALIAGLAAASTIMLSACGATINADAPKEVGATTSEKPVIVATSNIDKKNQLAAGQKVKIVATTPWVITDVTYNSGDGDLVGVVDSPGTHWESPPLAPQQSTTVKAQLTDPTTGETQQVTRTVLTGPAQDTFTASVFPDSDTWGVGVLPTVTFSKEVPTSQRKAMAAHLVVDSKPKAVKGKWHWDDGYTAVFRPKSFWPGRQRVTVHANIKNVLISDTSSKDAAWGKSNDAGTFKTGLGMVVYIDSPDHEGTVKIDGKVVRHFPTSTGKYGYTTRSGVKTITDKYYVQRMTNIGVTDDEVYDLQVPFAMRMTDSGEFLHAAPWNGNIGYANTSHGCTNLTMDDAEWIYDRAISGTPVVTTGTGREMETWNGPGGMWNINYASWDKN